MGIFKVLFGGAESPPKEFDAGLPFKTFAMHGKDALAFRESWLGEPGITPVILGSPDGIVLMKEILDDADAGLEEILAAAADLDVEEWLRTKRESDDEGYYAPEPGAWIDGVEELQLSVHRDILSGKPLANVIVGLVPTPNAWEVPAHVCYGNWNDVPPAPVHVALHKRWHERYGAAIACMSGDIIECTVARPPRTREEAMALAWEQFVYCSDIVHQGVESVEALASTLLESPVWYFWWD